MKIQHHEDSVRFVRQRLIALEDGRQEDADLLEEFIDSEFGVQIQDIKVQDIRDNFPELYERWVSVYGIPAGVEQVTVLVNKAKEPVWRMPVDLETRAVSWAEKPIHLVKEPTPFIPDPDYSKIPPHLHPRKNGDLPDEIAAAIRL